MVAETRYVAGSGLLLGSGDHWLLLTDPGDAAVVEELWTALRGPVPSARVLEAAERAFGGAVPGLALVDLGSPDAEELTRGHGEVRVQGATVTLALGERHDGPERPFLGGVVSASRVEVLRPARLDLPSPGAGLIDGIPQAILAAKGPDGPPPPRPRIRRPDPEDSISRDTTEPTGPRLPAPEPDPEPEVWQEAPIDTGSSTGSRPQDHDGSTVFRPEHLVAASSGESVQAVWCPQGHLTPPTDPLCRVCRSQVAPQHAQRVARPVLGGLRLPSGEVVPLDRAVVLGRRPQPVATSGEWPHLVTLPAEHSFVSRMHLHLSLEGWQVIARDLGSRGGTTLKVPGQEPVRMVPDHPYQLEPGHALDLADTYEIRYEVGPEAGEQGSGPLGRHDVSAPEIPGFTFVEHLGSGGFADVFLYEQAWPRQRVAVKIVRPDVPLTDREKSLFAAEANAMARLADHPYIVSVITAGITADGGRPFLVMRFCPPPDLGVRVRSNPMPVMEAVSTGIKLASAIETAHRSGILHRDIKPSNVLVTTYHEPALTDFGIAGHIQDVEGDHDVRISYPWSPPEMLDGRSNGSVTSDVYSLGATIWHLLVGRSPFSVPNGDNSTRALSARILHATPPATQRPDVPPALDRLLQQCLAKNPDHRPRTALDLARALQRIEADAGLPRTAVAVEGDRSDEAVALPTAPPPVEEDHTVMKAVTVISAEPRAKQEAGPEAGQPGDAEAPRRSQRAAAAWAVVAVLALIAVVTGLFLKGDPEPTGGPDPQDPAASTPLDLLPGVLDQPPTVKAKRTADGVRFSWSVPGGAESGDQWLVYHVEGDDYDRTSKRNAFFATQDRVCVQVTLERDGGDSPIARQCG